MRYLIEPKNKLYVNEYGFLSFAKNMGNNLSNVVKHLLKVLKNLQQLQ